MSDDTSDILLEVKLERRLQDKKWGEQNHPNGTGTPGARAMADLARDRCDLAAERGELTWADILREEFYEAMAESDPELLVEELIQVAAVAVAWVEAIDRADDE